MIRLLTNRRNGFSLLTVTILVASVATTTLAQPAEAQDQPDERTINMNYSLYFENYRNDNFEAALPYLRWMLENAPAAPRDDDRNFDRAYKTYQALAESADDDDTRKAFLDSALMVIDDTVPTLQDAGATVSEFKWALVRGNFIQSHGEELAEHQDEVAEDYLRAFELDPERLDRYYVEFIIRRYQDTDRKDEAIEFMERAEQVYHDNEELIEFFNRTRNTLFDSPEERLTWLEGQLESSPEDLSIMRELAELYEQTDQFEKQRDMAERMVEIQPTAVGYQNLARFYYNQGNYDAALHNFDRALEYVEDPQSNLARDIYYNKALMYQEMGRLQSARAEARRALNIDREFGPAYMVIADIYVMAVQDAGSMERRDRAVYWLALDYYERARDVDPSVASRANSNIRTYRQYIPDQEALFFEGWNPGDSYQINYGPYAWINEATTVRRP